MSEPRMDPYEAIAYGRFTAAQIVTLLLGLDAEMDPTLKLVAARVSLMADSLEVAILRTSAPVLLLHRPEPGEPDSVMLARKALRDVVHHAERCHGGFAFASRLLQGESLSTAVRRTPGKLLVRLEHACGVLERRRITLPEHEFWTNTLRTAHDDLVKLDERVKDLRSERRSFTSDATAAWATWERTYEAAKLIVQGVLVGCDKVGLEREVFDDIPDAPGRVSDVPKAPAS